MKFRSNKTSAIYRKWKPIRNQFLIEFPFCMVCGDTYRDHLAVHEMTPGANRLLGFVARETWLTACGVCNCDVLTDKLVWPVESQLALKLWYDPGFFSIEAINKIFGCVKVTAEQVLEELRELRIGGRLAA
jgi:hypothetical protein